MIHDRPPIQDTPPAQDEIARLRAMLAHVADTIDIALDADWREAIDLLLDLADKLRAEFRP